MQAEVEPHVAAWREAGICDKSAFLKAGEQGLLCMWVDEKYGGLGMDDFRFEQIVIEETMRHGDLGFFITLHSRLVGPYIGHLGSEALKGPRKRLPGAPRRFGHGSAARETGTGTAR